MSRVQIDSSAPILFQQRSDTGFASSEVGRATALLNGVRYRAKYLGTDANGLSVVIQIRGGPIRVTLDNLGLLITVPSGTTNAQLVAAVNQTVGSLLVAYAVLPVLVVTEGTVSLSGGLDPSLVANIHYRFDAPPGQQGGLFYHFLNRNQYVTQIEGAFTLAGPTPVQVHIVTLSEGFEPIPDEYGILYCTTITVAEPSFVITDARLQVLPYRAVRVQCAAPGTVRVQYQQAAVQTAV